MIQQDIVVVAERSEQSSIDRTTYVVKDNAEARASNVLDLLGRVPMVDVSPSGQVRLIGRSGVTIQVDGQEMPNANAFLRAMQGSQVAKIEVVTNPSAQFSARGTGGIINIVTRRSAGAGLGGSVTASAGSFGSYEGRISPSWSSGKLSLGGSIGVKHEGARSESEEEWMSVEAGAETSRVEVEEWRSDNDSLNASLRASVEIAPRHTLSFSGMVGQSEAQAYSESDILEDGVRSDEESSALTDAGFRQITVNTRRDGSRQGEQTSLSASRSWFDVETRRRSVAKGSGGTSVFRLSSESSTRDSSIKADHVRPAGDRRLSLGGQFQHHAEDNRQQVARSSSPAATDDDFSGSWSEAAAYVTYQFPLLGNKLLAGTRVESRRHDIGGTSDDPRARTHFFPSLHVERKLGEGLKANLGYSSRIGWPSLALLDPRLRFTDPTTARAGNPFLRPEKTHSFEFKLVAKAGRHEADLTAYYQRTRDLRTETVELEGDVLVSRPVNLGRRGSLGGNLNVRGPLARGLRYAVTADLAHDRIDETGLPGIDDEGTRYGASLQLEYRDGTEGRAGADQVRLSARYTGPSESGLTSLSSTMRADATWSHALTDRLAAVLTASHAFKTARIATFGRDVVSRTSIRSDGTTINLALTYALSPAGQ